MVCNSSVRKNIDADRTKQVLKSDRLFSYNCANVYDSTFSETCIRRRGAARFSRYLFNIPIVSHSVAFSFQYSHSVAFSTSLPLALKMPDCSPRT